MGWVPGKLGRAAQSGFEAPIAEALTVAKYSSGMGIGGGMESFAEETLRDGPQLLHIALSCSC